jgi:hypothetical protein
MQSITENVRESKPVQLELIPLSELPQSEPARKRVTFYYVTRKLNSEMMVGLDREGAPIWVEHDIRRVIPYRFNTQYQARKLARPKGWQVKAWPFGGVS